MYVGETAELRELCRAARAEGRLGLDAEFIRERTYRPHLALVQLAVGTRCVLVDPLADIDLEPLDELLPDPGVTKVLHAGTQDLEIFYQRTGAPPRAIFDTQLAAAMLGLGQQTSYGSLVERVLGVSLKKGQAFTDWLVRPLRPEQERYALSDVEHLLVLHDRLRAELEALGRSDWLAEELRRYEDPELYEPDPRTQFHRVRRASSLDARGLTVLRALAAWREEEARRRDRPRRRIIGDELLVELARRPARSVEELRGRRGLHPRQIEELGAGLVAATGEGLAVPREEAAQLDRGPRLEAADQELLPFIDACMRQLSSALRIDPSLVANSAAIQRLVQDHNRGTLRAEDHPVLQGWRGQEIGRSLVAALEGKLALRIDPTTRRLRVEEVDR